jgi:hypothetical protein
MNLNTISLPTKARPTKVYFVHVLGKPNRSIHPKKERKKEAHKMRTKMPKNLLAIFEPKPSSKPLMKVWVSE